MARLLLFLGLAAAVYFLFRWLSRQPARVQWQLIAVVAALVGLVLVLTGRAHWLAAVFAALLPFVRVFVNLLGAIPLLKRLLGGFGGARPGQAPGGGQQSTVQAEYIRMTLDHDSGDLAGEVLAGRFQGQRLDQLDLEDLLRLLDECAADEESVALLQAYLDRVHGDEWRQRAGARAQRQGARGSGEMSREEALQILGLDAGAGEAEITEAHRRLMQKLHPDRGGSAYLAARINLAKEILLGK